MRLREQGDLTDPSYFDFITFAQLATISREMQQGRQHFEVLFWCSRPKAAYHWRDAA